MQFSIHASAKEATSSKNMSMQLSNFSIHASAKEATHLFCLCYNIINFQSTPPRRRRHMYKSGLQKEENFQSTPPRRRRRDTFIKFSLFHFFNPRLREGGDYLPIFPGSTITIFNPRLREGGDNLKTGMWHCFTIFNPRLREGGDFAAFEDSVIVLEFSIHASAKEATRNWTVRCVTSCFSIHASAKEATKSGFGRVGFRNLFNPRLREGGDNATGETYAIMGIFQSTPPRRRRRAMVSGYIRKPRVFNPRLREGGDFSQGLIPIPIAVFNPRLREGGDGT